MIRKQTVFIIGAGASAEVQLPVGAELTRLIADFLRAGRNDLGEIKSNDRAFIEALRRHTTDLSGRREDINPYLRAASEIRNAMPLAASIDNFMEAHREDREIELCGKLGIARTILQAEASSELFFQADNQFDRYDHRKVGSTWYPALARILFEGVSRQDIENVFENITLISFNYDRCIEHYLTLAIGSYYRIADTEAQDLVNRRLKIFHPYGSVGRLRWQSSRAGTAADFGVASVSDLISIAKEIKTFSERIEEEDLLKSIRSAVSAAETIVFLGFAFHNQNMDLIAPSAPTKIENVYATVLGMSDSDQSVVRSDIIGKLGLDRLGYPADMQAVKMLSGECHKLFQYYSRSLSR